MQPGTNPDDIHDVLTRFNSWAGKQPGNGNGHQNGNGADGVREIPYEEAIRQYRDRHRAQGKRPEAAGTPPAMTQPPMEVPVPRKPSPVVEQKAETGLPSEKAAEPASEAKTAATRGSRKAVAPRAAKVEAAITSKAGSEVVPVAREKSTGVRKTAGARSPAVKGEKATRRLTAAARETPIAQLARRKPVRGAVEQPRRAVTLQHGRRAARVPEASRQATARKREGSETAPSVMTVARKPAVTPKDTAVVTKARASKQPEFREVLAKNVRSAKRAAGVRKVDPDRNLRITTRFSAQEQERIEEFAAREGLTVSAYLRERALSYSLFRSIRRALMVFRKGAHGKGTDTTPIRAQIF